ncbi:Gfo/Idh/MocA family oxidoreductase [Paenibacillus alginolyticus]|nr:Gfo/Idh/MocA family oxidoreductase [Paenibacillus alginolyticus]
MSSVVRWGIISTAKIAREELLPAYKQAENARVTAIASSNPKVREVASEFDIPTVYETYDELLNDPEIDAVYIPLPNNLHAEWTKKAAEKGKHVLCEKPAALSTCETVEMIDHCKKHGVFFMEAFMYQFHPQHKRIKEILASGELGELKIVKSSFSFFLEKPLENIRSKPDMGGGSLYDVGCYCIHAVRNILETEPDSVYASAIHIPGTMVDMSVNGIMHLKNGMSAMFDAAMDRTGQNHFEIVGTKGRLLATRSFLPQLYGGEAILEISVGDEVRTEKVSGHQYILQIEHFSKCVLDRTLPSYTPENTIQNMRVIDACYESIATGTVVRV